MPFMAGGDLLKRILAQKNQYFEKEVTFLAS